MWPFNAYPEVTADKVKNKAYDYIIVGGGTAGCVLASRLSENPDVSVLVLEKGHVKDNFVSRVPLISQNFWMGDPLQVQMSRYSEPMQSVNGRRNRIITAEGLGGASRINAMLWTRGVPGGYEQWATELGLDGWGWDKVEPYFRKSENVLSRSGTSERGHDGPIPLQHKAWPFQWHAHVEKAAKKLGLLVGHDCNDPSTLSMGLFDLEMAIHPNGHRASAYNTYLNKKLALSRKRHLTVCTGVVVSELDIHEGVVRGVNFKTTDNNGETMYVQAKREVIVCSGAICTPQILLLSGIGPRSQLQALKITVKKELPVGATLQDHCSTSIMVNMPKSDTLSLLESAAGLWHFLLFVFLGKGLMAASSTPKTSFICTAALDEDTMLVKVGPEQEYATNPGNVPDTEIMVMPVNGLERAVPGYSLLTFYPTLVQPKSVGSVEITTKDPMVNPRIHHPMFNDPEDFATFRKSIRFTMRLAEEFMSTYPKPTSIAFAPGANPELLAAWEKTAPEGADAVPPPAAGLTYTNGEGDGSFQKAEAQSSQSKTWKDVSDHEIDDYVKRTSMGSLHSACTCPMSRDEGAGGVVDQQLRVYGIKNLRIADASVFPRIPSGHLMAPTIMVAERCADIIKRDW